MMRVSLVYDCKHTFTTSAMVRFATTLATATYLALATQPRPCYSLYQDEAGLNDFLISTAGHGRVMRSLFAQNGEILITGAPMHSCYVAARSVQTGSLLWRKNFCSDGGRGMSSSVQMLSLSKDGSTLMVHDGEILKGVEVVRGDVVMDERYISSKSIDLMPDVKFSLNNLAANLKKGICEAAKAHFAVAAFIADDGLAEVRIYEIEKDNHKLIQSDILPQSLFQSSINGDIVDIFPSCANLSNGSIEALITTSGGTSVMIQALLFTEKETAVGSLWSHEEALASVQSAVLLDNSLHVPIDEMVDVLFQERLSLQLEGGIAFLKSLKTKILSGSAFVGDTSDETDVFGFRKIAVALSESTTSRSRLFGIDTLAKGDLQWTLLFPEKSKKNVVIKDVVSPSTSLHSSELLVVSELDDGNTLEWRCVDGIHGNVLDKGSLKLSNLSQLFPIDATSNAKHCRQVVLALDKDGNTSVIPSNEDTLSVAASVIETNDFFLHIINRESGSITSLSIEESQVNQNTQFSSSIVGEARISGKIISVAYPSPVETIQSPASIMGDDSLLLKYLNPHLVVIVSQEYEQDVKSFENNPPDFMMAENAAKSSKKPQGVSKPGESSPAVTQTPPSLFITLVDTVSAKVLHRISHADASGHPDIGLNEIPVVISENWIAYSYWNHRTKRSEIGVLTLYEGKFTDLCYHIIQTINNILKNMFAVDST